MSHRRWMMVRISAFVTTVLCTDFLGASQHTQISPENSINCIQEKHSNRQNCVQKNFLRKIRRFLLTEFEFDHEFESESETISSSWSPEFEYRVRVRVPSSNSSWSPKFEARVRVPSSSVSRDHWHHHLPTFESTELTITIYYKVRQGGYYKVRQLCLLQSATRLYYKVR